MEQLVKNPEAAMTQIEVIYQAEQNLESWVQRSLRGEVPSRWPYGLHELQTWDAHVTAASLANPGAAARLLAQVVPGAVRSRLTAGTAGRAGRAGRDVGITWDENAARRMLIQNPHREMYTGVVWLTDMLAAAPSSYAGLLRALRQMDHLWVLSRPQVDALQDVLGEKGPPVSFVPFGVDSSFFVQADYPSKPMVLSVGNDRHRDTETLFSALELVHARRPDVEMVVQTRSELQAPKGATRIQPVPHRELRQLYARSSVMAVATKSNIHASGLTVALEAMATGRPVVITRTPGMEDYVADGETGLLCEANDPEAMGESILAILEDPGRAREMGQRGRQVLEESFTTSHTVRGIAQLAGLSEPTGQAPASF